MALASVQDPLIDLKPLDSLLVTSGGAAYSWQQYPASSYSSSNVQWTIQMPSTNSILDRCLLVDATITLTFTGTPFDANTPLVQLGVMDAVRDWPLAHSVGTNNVMFNQMTLTQDHQYLDALFRMNLTKNAHLHGASSFPNMLDVFPSYSGWQNLPGTRSGGFTRHPLAQGFVNGELGRGSWSYNVISNAPGASTATIQFKVLEPVVMPPFLQSIEDGARSMGLTNLQNFQMIWSNLNLSRTWSHDAIASGTSTISSISGVFASAPILRMRIASLKQGDSIPRSLNYPWLSINMVPTAFPTSLTSGQTYSLTTTASVYKQIPRKIIITCPQQVSDRNFSSSSTFLSINNIAVNFGDLQNQMQQASQIDLYRSSLLNGYVGSYDDWSNQSGSVLIIVPGRDFPLPDGLAPGSTGSYSMNFVINVTNLNPATITPVCYVINLDDGYLNVTDNIWRQEIVSLAPAEVKQAERATVPEEEVKGSLIGGSLFNSLRAAVKASRGMPPVKELGMGYKSGGRRVMFRGAGYVDDKSDDIEEPPVKRARFGQL